MAQFIPTCTGGNHYISTGSIKKKFLELLNLITAMSLQYDSDVFPPYNLNTETNNRLNDLLTSNDLYQSQRLSELLIEIAIMIRLLCDFHYRGSSA